MVLLLSCIIVILLVIIYWLWGTNRHLLQRLHEEVESYHHERKQKIKLQKERNEWNNMKKRRRKVLRPPGW